MRFYSESKFTKISRQKLWHDWFAWYPVRIHDEIVWLETIQRRRPENLAWWHRLKK